MVRLNLCCGLDIREGYINADVRRTRPDVYMLDLEKDLLKPFADGSAEEIIAKDCIEHISWRRIEDLLRDIYRVLVCGGRLYIQVPDLEAIAKKIILNPSYCHGDLCGWKAISFWVYGGQDYPENTHKAGFTIPTLRRLLESLGFIVESIMNDGGTNIMCWARKRC
jgi:predicted SAM-dependent methyltransferase